METFFAPATALDILLQKSVPTPWNKYFIHYRNTEAGTSGFAGDGPLGVAGLPTDVYVSGSPTRGNPLDLEYGSNGGTTTAGDAPDNTNSPPFTGRVSLTSEGMWQLIKMPDGPGTYRIKLCFGHWSSVTTAAIIRYGGTTSTILKTIAPTAITGGQFLDCDGVLHTSESAFLSNSAYLDVDMESGNQVLAITQNSSTRCDLSWVSFERML